MASHGRPIHLAMPKDGADEKSTRFQLNPNICREMEELERLQRAKVAVISVAGAFRKGKSFLLNFFLGFLTALVSENTSNWIQRVQCHSEGDGFHWRSGSTRDTTGILVWSQPFFFKRQNEQEVAVLLMDTQGTFDHQSTQQDCTTIFAFSTLISSVQIFNISRDVTEAELQHLRLFVEFAALAKGSNGKVLQHLWFLVRDWQYPDEYAYGVDGGNAYLGNVLACDEGKPEENKELRRGIQKHFEQLYCCLLPYPGSAVSSSSFRGEVSKLDVEFVQEMEKFIQRVADPKNLVLKKVNGKELTGKELIDFLEIYFEAFSSGKMPSPKSVFTATVEMANISAAAEAKQLFESKVQDFIDPSKGEDAFRAVLEQAEKQSIELFNSRCMEKDSPDARKARQKLKEDLQRLRSTAITHRQLRSEKLSAENKSEVMKTEMDTLKLQNLENQKRMEKVTAEFEDRMEEIKKKSISKEEMEKLLLEESIKQATVRREMEDRNNDLNRRVQQLMEANSRMGSSPADMSGLQMFMLNYELMATRHRMQEMQKEQKSSDVSCRIL